jgi:2-haloacid dehalogenase
MAERLKAVAVDSFQTVFSLESLRPRLAKAGVKGEGLEVWFGRVLWEGFALTVTGDFRPFEEVARAEMEVVLANQGAEPSEAGYVMDGLKELEAESDVGPALERLARAGVGVWVVTTGGKGATEALLALAGLAKHVTGVVSIDEVGRWKPHREVYERVAGEAGVSVGEMGLVAAHDWDLHGAKRAGMRTGWVRRTDRRLAWTLAGPDVTGDGMGEVCERLVEGK